MVKPLICAGVDAPVSSLWQGGGGERVTPGHRPGDLDELVRAALEIVADASWWMSVDLPTESTGELQGTLGTSLGTVREKPRAKPDLEIRSRF